MEKQIQMKIILDQDRMIEELTVDQFIQVQEGDIRTIKSVLSMFAYDMAGNSIPAEKASEILGSLKIGELMELAKNFGKKVEDTAVPPGKGAV